MTYGSLIGYARSDDQSGKDTGEASRGPGQKGYQLLVVTIVRAVLRSQIGVRMQRRLPSGFNLSQLNLKNLTHQYLSS